jgi:ribonuclease HI
VLDSGTTTGWFNGAAQDSGMKSGASVVISTDVHTKFRWTLNYGSGTNNRAKMLGVWALLALASQLHIQDLQVFGDSRIVIEWLNQRGKLQILNLHCWKKRVKELAKGFKTLCFTHVFREFNK